MAASSSPLTVVRGDLLRSGLFTVITLIIGCSINRRTRRVTRRNGNDSVTNNVARQLFAQRIPNHPTINCSRPHSPSPLKFRGVHTLVPTGGKACFFSGPKAKDVRTESDTQTAFTCTNPSKCDSVQVAVNALIVARFLQNRAVSRNGEIGFDSRTRCAIFPSDDPCCGSFMSNS